MNWLLERKLKNLGKQAAPEPLFVRTLEKKLKAEVGHPLWWFGTRGWTVTVAATLCLACSATGAYAFTSDDVLPDHPLYGVRMTMEKAEEAVVSVNPVVKAHVQAVHLEKRLKERTLQKAKNKTVAKEDVQNFVTNLDTLVDDSQNLPEPAQEKVQKKVEALEEKQEALMKEAGDDDEKISQQMQKITQKIKDIRERKKIRIEMRRQENSASEKSGDGEKTDGRN